MTRPEEIKPIWDRIVGRALTLGFAPPEAEATTTDAGIRLLVDGREARPLAEQAGSVAFMVPAGARSIRLLSRSARPNAARPWFDDPRRLGVAISSVVLRDRTGETELGADHPALRDGWHDAEYAADGATWRWSGGDAGLPIRADGPCIVEIRLSETTIYPETLVA